MQLVHFSTCAIGTLFDLCNWYTSRFVQLVHFSTCAKMLISSEWSFLLNNKEMLTGFALIIFLIVEMCSFALQYATKTLASCLQQPTKSAWNALGRSEGYLRFSEDFGLKMEKSERGNTFMDVQLKQQNHDHENSTLEIYSDSDWSGSGDMKSTSSAVHVMNGIIIHSTGRSQKCISLSSTEAEWYAASAGVCDAYYLRHIVEFVTDGKCNILTLHTDNSAVRMLSLKFEVGRLRHIRGRMLWLQQKMSNDELNIKQVPTAYNIADLNTKGLGRDRFLSLLYMIGFVDSKGEPVGEAEFLRLQAKERTKSHVKVIGSCLKDTASMTSHGVSSTSMNKTAKRVLRFLSTCSLLELADSDEMVIMSPEPEALGQWHFKWWYFVLRGMVALLCMVVGFSFLAARGFFNRCGQAVRGQPVEQPEVPVED